MGCHVVFFPLYWQVMPRQIIMDDRDEAAWLLARKFVISASDLCNFGNLGPSYWPDRRPEILADKLQNVPRVFGKTPAEKEHAVRRMEHGKFNEDNNLRKFSRYSKLRTKPAHWFITNNRWPWLGATLDGVVARPNTRKEIDPRVFTRADHVQQMRDEMLFLDSPVGICELKQHENKPNKRNEYFGHVKRNGTHVPPIVPLSVMIQVQGQMHIADFTWAVVVAQIGAVHMAAHLVRRDEGFADTLDEINDAFQAAVKQHRADIWGPFTAAA